MPTKRPLRLRGGDRQQVRAVAGAEFEHRRRVRRQRVEAMQDGDRAQPVRVRARVRPAVVGDGLVRFLQRVVDAGSTSPGAHGALPRGGRALGGPSTLIARRLRAGALRAGLTAVVAARACVDALGPPRLERVGERGRQPRARRADAPAEAAPGRDLELVEADDRPREERVESQHDAQARAARARLRVVPVRPLDRRGHHDAGAEQALRRHAEAHEERAAAGLDVAEAPAGPARVEVAAALERRDVRGQLGPVPQRRVEREQVGAHVDRRGVVLRVRAGILVYRVRSSLDSSRRNQGPCVVARPRRTTRYGVGRAPGLTLDFIRSFIVGTSDSVHHLPDAHDDRDADPAARLGARPRRHRRRRPARSAHARARRRSRPRRRRRRARPRRRRSTTRRTVRPRSSPPTSIAYPTRCRAPSPCTASPTGPTS